MITALCLLLMVYALYKMSKKDKHNIMEDEAAIVQLPSFDIHAKPMSAFSKILNFGTSKKHLLSRFTYSDRLITIVLADERTLVSPLDAIFVDFVKNNGILEYHLKTKTQKIYFYQTSNISTKEWEAINSVLCLAGSTRGRRNVSKAAKYANYVNLAFKAIKALS